MASPTDAAALVTKVDGGDLQFLTLDVFPDVHLGPVGERKHTHVLTRIQATVVEVPDLGSLVLGIPLAEAIAEAEEALLGAGFFLVAAGAADAAIEAELLDRP